MQQYLIVCPLVFLAGLIDSIAGGGGLISLPAFLLAGVSPHMALGTNKLSSTLGTSISTMRFARNGYINWKIAGFSSVMAIAGSFLGASISLLIEEKVIQNMMLVVLPVVAYYVLKNKNMGNNERTGKLKEKQILIICMCAAFFIGAYDGFYGPGTGTFLLLVLTGAAGLDIKSASGITKVINLSSNIMALVTFMINGVVVYPLGLAAGAFCIAGHYIGSGLVVGNGQRIVRPVILIVLVVLFVKVVA